MRPSLLLAILSFLTLRSCQSYYVEQDPQDSNLKERLNTDNFPRDNLKRYNDIDYDTFVGLMGRRSAGDIDDIFVGLMGRRSPESSHLQSWRKAEYPQAGGAILFNKAKFSLTCEKDHGYDQWWVVDREQDHPSNDETKTT